VSRERLLIRRIAKANPAAFEPTDGRRDWCRSTFINVCVSTGEKQADFEADTGHKY